jgi:Short C-terminal domain
MRRGLATVLVVFATFFAFLAIFALWANRQLLDTDNWTDTSAELLEDDAIREQLSIFLVDELYANIDIQARIEEALPPRADVLAAPAASGLRGPLEDAADEILQRPRAQDAWEQANRVAHENFLKVVEDKGEAVSTTGGDVTLDLKQFLELTEQRVGVGGRVAERIPEGAAQLTILRSDELEFAQDVVDLMKTLAIVLVVLAFGLFALAVYLAKGRRRQTLRACGIGFILAGVGALVARAIAGGAVVDALVEAESVRPAVENTWDISTTLLEEAAGATILYGVFIVIAAWLAGPTALAVATRRALAPYLREPRYAYGGFALIALLLIAWGPTPALRKPLTAAILIALLAVGVEALRRLTAREHPDASIEEAGRRMHERLSSMRERVSGSGRGSRGQGSDAKLDELERLVTLRDSGALDEAEFDREKARLLGSAPASNT